MALKALGSVKSTNSVILTSANLASEVSGILPVANGGSGQSTFTNGQLLIGNTTGNTLTKATLTPGTNIDIINGAGSITLVAGAGLETVEVRQRNITTTTTLTIADNGKVITINGASSLVNITLPVATIDQKLTFLVTDADGMKLIGNGSEQIRVAGSSANTQTCTQIGGALILYALAGSWFAASIVRTWTGV
ncbi:MAG: hypothetical protein ACREVA_00285 [Burkholderiales bacterium]